MKLSRWAFALAVMSLTAARPGQAGLVRNRLGPALDGVPQ